MSKSQWKLTENGVFALYEEHLKEEVKVQVIFKAQIDDVCYLRVSDGRHLSPVVLILTDEVVGTRFCVGSVISIKERDLISCDEYDEDNQLQISMEDNGIKHVCIKYFTLVASHKTVGCVLGSLDHDITYREELRQAISIMTRWDPDKELRKLEQGLGDCHINLMEADRFRERGNSFFRQENFLEAVTCYDVAKYKNPFDCRLWSNSSHAHFKMEEYLEAELHALIAIKMNPFYEKAYYRAGQAALKDRRRHMVEQYAQRGIYVCGVTKELQQILEEATKIPYDDDPEDFLSSFLPCSLRGLLDSTESIVRSAVLSYNNERLTELEELRKKRADLSGACGKDQKEGKKGTRKPRRVEKMISAALAAAATANSNSKEQQKMSKEEEEKKHYQESRRETKNHKPKINFNEALEAGKRLFECEQFHQAIEMYNKCLTSNELGDHTTNHKVKGNERYDLQVIHFIIAVCKVQCSRGYIFEGLETMKTLCGDDSKFPHKPAARYWLALSFEKICCFKLAQKHAQLCKDALKKPKSIKPIKWPNTEQSIKCTLPNALEDGCKLVLERSTSAKPTPKAKCRFKNCITAQGIPYAKEQIYLTDPDFKGYLNVICEEDCTVSYHPCCWKALKEQHDRGINRMSDKDFLGQVCVTPDCTGKISSIHIYDDMGELKNEVVKDKKDKKHLAAPVKQKKKKDKKREKVQAHKKRTRVESACEDQATAEETSPVGAEGTSTTTTTTTNNNTNNNKDKNNRSHPIPALPIDPESLEKAQVTILKPGGETEPSTPTKAAKKNKRKKAKKTVTQPNLLGDPLEVDFCVQSEYIARLRVLRQQKDALESDETSNTMMPTSVSEAQNPVMLLDPDNPFYLPQHLKDNPEELECVLQEKLTTSSPPGLAQETINTLLDFMYDWLKSEGPMHVSDPRLAEQVADNFPQEARDYVSHCGGITGLLKQSIKFAMIDSIICVCDDVMTALEMMCEEVNDKMNQSKYLIRYSDGQKAKRFTHLLDDAKSTCSTTSLAESSISNDSAYNRWLSAASNDDHNNNDKEDVESLAPLSKRIVDQFNKFETGDLNPGAPEFQPNNSNCEDDDEEEEEEEEDERQWINEDSEYIEKWAAQAGEEVHLMPDEDLDVVEVVVEEEMDEQAGLIEVEEDMERTERYISELQQDKENLTRDLQKEQEQNQALSDKLYQVKSQYKSEVMKLKRELEELRDQNKELNVEKNAIQSQKETDTKKQKSDLSRIIEEMKNYQSQVQSLQVKNERFLDENNEVNAKLAEEMEVNAQLKGELEKMKSLQESLTSCSRRARDAEVQYLCTKKDLVDADMSRSINRLNQEATIMRQLLPIVTEDSVLDRTTLTRTIVAWDEAIKNLLEQQQVFKEEITRLLGMVHQGRPLSALSSGDLPIPAIPGLTVAPLLHLLLVNPKPPTLVIPEGATQSHLIATPPPLMTEPPSQGHGVALPLIQASAAPNGHMFVHGAAPSLPSAYASGAIPKNTAAAQPTVPSSKTSEIPSPTQMLENPDQLFVGQLPWEYSEADVKNLFSRFGEVVSVTVFDKGCNADGRPVPKYGFITFRNPEDCLKALSARPIYVRNHMLNVQAKEAKKPGGGGGVSGVINEPDATIGKKSSLNGLTDITVSTSVEGNKSSAAHHHTLPTPPTLHHHQPPPPTTQSVIKPKFQKLLPSNNTAGGIVAPPPKLVRPQGKTVPNTSKLGGQTAATKEENAMPVSASYARLIDICKQRFGKEYSSPDICTALREVRVQNNNSLSGLTTDRIVERVRLQLRSRRPSVGVATVAPWAGLTQGKGVKKEPTWQGPNKEEVVKEESCSICLEPLNTSPNQSLSCLHTFHARCINDWIKIQSSCPNCRKLALMPDEYPTLSHA